MEEAARPRRSNGRCRASQEALAHGIPLLIAGHGETKVEAAADHSAALQAACCDGAPGPARARAGAQPGDCPQGTHRGDGAKRRDSEPISALQRKRADEPGPPGGTCLVGAGPEKARGGVSSELARRSPARSPIA